MKIAKFKLTPDYSECIDPHEPIIHILYGDSALHYAEINYRWCGDANCCSLHAGAIPKDYSFPVHNKFVVIENCGSSDMWIAMLVEEVLKQCALGVFAVSDDELIVRYANKQSRMTA